jgi:hypothetical protein
VHYLNHNSYQMMSSYRCSVCIGDLGCICHQWLSKIVNFVARVIIGQTVINLPLLFGPEFEDNTKFCFSCICHEKAYANTDNCTDEQGCICSISYDERMCR